MKDDRKELAELAAAMNNLSESLREFNGLIAEMKRDDPEWTNLPSTLVELNRRLMALCTPLVRGGGVPVEAAVLAVPVLVAVAVAVYLSCFFSRLSGGAVD